MKIKFKKRLIADDIYQLTVPSGHSYLVRVSSYNTDETRDFQLFRDHGWTHLMTGTWGQLTRALSV